MTRKKLQNKLGQNTAEYLIMLVLISVGSIGIFSVFGGTIKHQVSNVIAAMTGDTDRYNTSFDSVNRDAETRASSTMSMGGISEDELEYSSSSE